MTQANEIPIFSGEQNLSFGERAASVVGGLGLMAIAAKPRPNVLLSVAVLVAGAALALRGAGGHCPFKAMTDESGGRLSGPDRA